jgi:hypothetical protein
MPVGIVLLWLSNWRMRWKLIWSSVFGLLVLLIIIGSITGDSNKDENPKVEAPPTAKATLVSPSSVAPSPPPDAEASPTVLAAPTAPPTPDWSHGGQITQESALKALKDGKELIRSVDIGKPTGLSVDGAKVTVQYKVEDALGETDLLTVAAETSFSAHRALWANPQVETVTVLIFADWTDQLGNTETEQTTESTLQRATVNQINWGGLEDRVYADNKHMFCVSDAYLVHLGIYTRLKDVGCLITAGR